MEDLMIDLKNYNLIFYRKKDSQRFIGRRVCAGRYVLIDVITEEKIEISRHSLGKLFNKDSENRKVNMKELKRTA
jgi:hypothetical protein